MAIVSPALVVPIAHATQDALLTVSSFVLHLLEGLLDAEFLGRQDRGDLQTFTSVAARDNRRALRTALRGTGLVSASPASQLGVECIQLPEGWGAGAFSAYLLRGGVAVLPGGPFSWQDPVGGERLVRVALSRDREYFQEAMALLRSLTIRCIEGRQAPQHATAHTILPDLARAAVADLSGRPDLRPGTPATPATLSQGVAAGAFPRRSSVPAGERTRGGNSNGPLGCW